MYTLLRVKRDSKINTDLLLLSPQPGQYVTHGAHSKVNKWYIDNNALNNYVSRFIQQLEVYFILDGKYTHCIICFGDFNVCRENLK